MENIYFCYRCKFNTNKRSTIINHFTKKKLCIKRLTTYFIPNDILFEMSKIPCITNDDNISNNQCKCCLKYFSCNYNLDRHYKKCFEKYKKQNILVKYNLFTYIDIKKYITFFHENISLLYFDKNKKYTSFYEEWDINHIDLLMKKLLYMSSDKYSDLLRKILDNDKNLNIIYDSNELYGYILNNNNIEVISTKYIVDKTMKKIYNIYNQIESDLYENDKLIDKIELNKEHNIIQHKYSLYMNNNIIYDKVKNLILTIYSEKFIEIQKSTIYKLKILDSII